MHRNLAFALLSLAMLSACVTRTVTLPTDPPRQQPVASINTENTGSLFHATSAMMLYQDLSAYRVGDLLTVEIAESMSSSDKQDTSIKKDSSIKATGTGATENMSAFLKTLFNMDLSGTDSLSYSSKGASSSSQSLTGSITVSVIDVRPNGTLTVAGEKKITSGNNATTLRFSGLVNRKDIKQGSIVSSKNVADVRIERIGQGVVSDPDTMGWLQRLFLSAMDL